MRAADIAWMLTSTALVMIMTPGLAFFYGGLVDHQGQGELYMAKHPIFFRGISNLRDLPRVS